MKKIIIPIIACTILCNLYNTVFANIEEEKFTIHTIEQGETLTEIAEKYYGDYKKWTWIIRFNENIKNPEQIQIGEEIKIPYIFLENDKYLPTLWPVDSIKITSRFGLRKDPITSERKKHEGIDIKARLGEYIFASGSGEVIFSGWRGNYGYAIIINHYNGLTSLYGHCSKILVKKGIIVTKGDLIGKVGSSGKSTGNHLHFEVRLNDRPINPFKYIQ